MLSARKRQALGDFIVGALLIDALQHGQESAANVWADRDGWATTTDHGQTPLPRPSYPAAARVHVREAPTVRDSLYGRAPYLKVGIADECLREGRQT